MRKYLACTVALAMPLMMAGAASAQTTAKPPAPAAAAAPTSAVPPEAMSAAPTPAAAASSAQLTTADKNFVQKAAQGGVAEVQMGQLAQQKADNADVKQFAQTMIDDHTANDDQLAKLATTKGLNPPTDVGPMQQKMLTRLQGLDGKKFDRSYVNGQVKAHTAMLKLFQTEAKTTKDADLKAFAEQTVTTIEHHLTMAQGLAKAGA